MRERILRGVGLFTAVSISVMPGVSMETRLKIHPPHEATLPSDILRNSQPPEGIRIDRDKNPKKKPCYLPPSLRKPR